MPGYTFSSHAKLISQLSLDTLKEPFKVYSLQEFDLYLRKSKRPL